MTEEQDWFVRKGDKDYGPCSARQLKQLAEAQKITPDTLVRRGKAGGFVAARQVKGLFQDQSIAPIPREPPITKRTASDSWPPSVPPAERNPPSEGRSPPVVQSIMPTDVVVRQPRQQTSYSSSHAKVPLLFAGLAIGGTLMLALCAGLIGLLVLGGSGSNTEKVIAKAEPSVALIQGRVFSGTGFVVQSGTIVTNKHVIGAELVSDLKVCFPSAKENGQFAVELLYEDPECDLAFLSVNTSLPPLKVARQHRFRRGEEVIVIGNPGASDELVLENAISRGVMSTQAKINGQEYYQLGIAINSGNSGGPVLDSTGQVIGVVTLKASEKEGLGFCIPLHKLNNATARVGKLTAKEINVTQSQHRLKVVARRVAATGQMYKLAMQGYTEEMEKAINNRKKPDDGLKAIRGQVEKLFKPIEQSIDSLKDEAAKIGTDPNVPEATRQRFIDLWANYLELRSYVDNPRGNFLSYRTKASELSDNHDRLSHSLKLSIGIDE